MAKFGIGVGEDFPVDEPKPGETPQPDGARRSCAGRRHGWRGHHRFGFLPFLFRILFVVAVIGAVSFLFHPHFYPWYPAPYSYGGYYPYAPHFGFFFPGLLIFVLVILAFRHGHHHHHDHWHRGRRDSEEGR